MQTIARVAQLAALLAVGMTTAFRDDTSTVLVDEQTKASAFGGDFCTHYKNPGCYVRSGTCCVLKDNLWTPDLNGDLGEYSQLPQPKFCCDEAHTDQCGYGYSVPPLKCGVFVPTAR